MAGFLGFDTLAGPAVTATVVAPSAPAVGAASGTGHPARSGWVAVSNLLRPKTHRPPAFPPHTALCPVSLHARGHPGDYELTARPRCAPGGTDSSADRLWLRSRRDTSRSLAGPARELAVCYQDRPLEPVTDSDRTHRVVASARLERRGFDLTTIDSGRSGFRRLEPQGSRVVIGCPRFDTRRPTDGDDAWSGCDRPVRSRVSGVV